MPPNKHNKDYLKDLEEWQNKQYTPGYYVGGKFNPAMKYFGKKLIKTSLIFAIIAIIAILIIAILTQ